MSTSTQFRYNTVRFGKFMRWIGFATFSVKNINDEKVHVTKTDFMLLLANLSISVFMILISFYFALNTTIGEGRTLLHYVTSFVMTSASLVCFVSIITVFCFRNKVWRFVVTLDEINTIFEKIGINVVIKNFGTLVTSCIVFCVSLIITGLLLMVSLEYDKKPLLLIFFAYSSYSYSTIMVWMILFHMAIFRRFRFLNDALR
jgi:hypothetical protein